jgi:hypothetical protein
MPHCPQNNIDLLDNMHRQTNGPRLIHDAAFNTLPYPPCRVSGKTKPALRIKLFKRMNQTKIAFLDQVKQRNATIQVALGNIYDQPKIVLNHFLASRKITRS